ncbi:MAG: bifunctional homocysteine S-methyltransferase/methylenetetrahydrofolate reductase [Candidatus Eisenbacteria bacterium]
MRQRFLERVERAPILCDGAMGTVLYERGVFVNRCFDELNLSQPSLVLEVHQEYLRAGAEILETNTFGANRIKLAGHGLEDKVGEINTAGVTLARKAIEETKRDAFVAGSVGPMGNPRHTLDLDLAQLRRIYQEQIDVLVSAGIDVLFVETISRREEMAAALDVARGYSDLAVVALMTFGDDGHTVQGDSPANLARWMRDQGADIVGCNCSTGPRAMVDVLNEMRSAGDDIVLAAMPNAGSPEFVEGRYIYFSSPEYMATYARRFVRGPRAHIVGGCCGTTPDHVREMRAYLRSVGSAQVELVEPQHPTETAEGPVSPVPVEERSRLSAKLAAGEFVTSVEISPPRGVDPSKVLSAINRLRDAGVDAVNIPDGPRASARMSPMALSAIITREVGIEAILHYCCRDRNLLGMQSDLLGTHALGIRNLIVITGDPPKLGDYPQATAVFDVDSIGLTRIVSRLNQGLDLGGNPLGPPTSFFIGVGVNPGAVNLDEEIRRFRLKVEAGANCAYTQPVFDPTRLFTFLERTADIPIPILVGILPLNSHRNAEFFHNEVPGMDVPDDVRERMRLAGNGDEAKRTGVEIAKEALALARTSPRIRGAYVMPPFGRAARALDVLEGIVSGN